MVGSTPSGFTFEDGTTDNWSANGQGISDVQASTTFAHDGSYSIQGTLSNTSSTAFPYIAISTNDTSSYPHAGQTISVYVYVDNTNASLNAKLFVTNNSKWYTGDTLQLTSNTWNHLTYTVPTTTTQLQQFGIQFNSDGSGSNINVYVDGISWA